jgi:glycosyltransferase involved in cell wall biosynthesis
MTATAEKLTISIAMTTFNGATYLEEQLDSLLGQQHLPAELVVGDDGSEDETLSILERFARKAPFPILVHRNPSRLGFRANFIHTAERCRGELITFCDQDDIWRADNLAKVAACFEDPDVLLTFHNARIVDQSRRPISAFYADPPAPERSPRLTLPAWLAGYGFTQTFRSNLLPATALWHTVKDYFRKDTEMGHGVFFFLLASGLGTVCYLNEELAEYRLHERNTMGTGKRTRASFVERWRYRLENRSETYRHLSHIAVLNAELFTGLSTLETFSPLLRQRAAEAAEAWQPLGPVYADRAILCSASLPDRMSSFFRLYRRGAYSEGSFWTFGRKGLVKDAVLGLLLADIVLKYGKLSSGAADRTCRRGRRAVLRDDAGETRIASQPAAAA